MIFLSIVRFVEKFSILFQSNGQMINSLFVTLKIQIGLSQRKMGLNEITLLFSMREDQNLMGVNSSKI